ncbi:unnamed protein product [Prunus armeniaca]
MRFIFIFICFKFMISNNILDISLFRIFQCIFLLLLTFSSTFLNISNKEKEKAWQKKKRKRKCGAHNKHAKRRRGWNKKEKIS